MTALALRGSDVPTALTEQMTLARALAASGLLPPHLAGKPENLLAIMFAARSIDVPLWTAVSGMAVISGKVSISADLQRALILRAGHTFRVLESTTERATVLGIRREDRDRFEHVSTFTAADARTANLTGGSWRTHPRAMLVARATTQLARTAFADVIAGMPAETTAAGNEDDGDGYEVETSLHLAQHLERAPTGAMALERGHDEDVWEVEEHPESAQGDPSPAQIFPDDFAPRRRPFDVESWQARLDIATTDVDFTGLHAQLATARTDGMLDEDMYTVLVESGKLRRRQLNESPVTW